MVVMNLWKIITIILVIAIAIMGFKLINNQEELQDIQGLNISSESFNSLLEKAPVDIPFKLCSIEQDKCIGLVKRNIEK